MIGFALSVTFYFVVFDYLLETCSLLMREREKGNGSRGEVGGTGRSRGKGN